jgi:hydrogenase maturation factor
MCVGVPSKIVKIYDYMALVLHGKIFARNTLDNIF